MIFLEIQSYTPVNSREFKWVEYKAILFIQRFKKLNPSCPSPKMEFLPDRLRVGFSFNTEEEAALFKLTYL